MLREKEKVFILVIKHILNKLSGPNNILLEVSL